MNYDELLKKAREKIPAQSEKSERFNPPVLDSFVEGNKTIIRNLHVLANYLNREIEHIIKYLSKELATSGNNEGNRVVFIGKFYNKAINDKMQQYIHEYVKCRECGSPDTKFVKDERFVILHCMACQARRPVPKVK